MVAVDNSFTDAPRSLLSVHSRMQFTGRLDVQASGQNWSLFLYMGRLIWATGGMHPVRRWYRQMAQHCPHVDPQSLNFRETDNLTCWDYQLLSILVKRQQVSVEQAVGFIRSNLTEVIFDIVQQEETKPVTCQSDMQDVLNNSLTVINTEQMLQEVQQVWNEWRALGLVDHSPNLVPVLRQLDQLQAQSSEKVYRTLVSLIDGKRTLRDIAASIKQDPLSLTRMLIPFFRKGFVGLTQIPDLPSPLPPIAFSPSPSLAEATAPSPLPITTPLPTPLPTSGPIIACIDDSQWECDNMQEILTLAGYRFVGIQDSVQALPLLLEKKPNLIFLDLVMPIASGYEICAQLRRVSQFKATPIVILTNNDGIIDRVRAKVVGCSDFISKPINADKVLTVVRKYLPSR